MTHELILTSAAQGLDPHSHGLCPVAADSEISPRLVQYLSDLSHYRSLAAEPEDSPRQSPIAYSHIILPGGIEHVLSRVADAGTDEQNQPNILAHHIVAEGIECSAESPAWLLALPGFHISEWNGPPIQFPKGRPIPTLTNPTSLTRRQQIARQRRWLDPQKMTLTGSVDTESVFYSAAVQRNDDQITLAVPPTSPCPVWQELTGDPGWGGVLAETVFTGQPVVLIYHPGQNILPLYVEALALLPQYAAWRTTFSTYFTGLPETFPCQWKGVLAGSEEVKHLVKDLNNLVLDLTVPMGAAFSGIYVDFARQGQEHMLPLDAEELAAVAASADTNAYEDEAKKKTDKLHTLPDAPPNPTPAIPVPKIQLPKKRESLLESFLRRSSRFQFYFLYSVMFVLVLFLLVFAVDQAGNFGIVQMLQTWNQSPAFVPPDGPKPEMESELDAATKPESEQTQHDVCSETENAQKNFEKNREQQQLPLLLFWETFDVPEFLAISFPDVQEGQINVPETVTFDDLSPLYPFGSALELQFIPLFERFSMAVQTVPVIDAFPDLVWQVDAVDSETHLVTPMFLFQLTESGLEMDWQPEGLNPQYLYDTTLSSLGFLQLSVADVPESARPIPLVAPVETTPVKFSDLAQLFGAETPEYAVDLPFASELWMQIAAETNLPGTLRLVVRAEPEGNWVRVEPSPVSEFHAEVRTSQQAGKQTEGGETVFENIGIRFLAEASWQNVVWKGDGYAERLDSERQNTMFAKEELEKKIEQLETQIFEGNTNVRPERDESKAGLRMLDLRLAEIESILEKLPAAYKEISDNESACFHYSVFLESESGNRTLLILKTVP